MVAVFHRANVVVKMKSSKNVARLALKRVTTNQPSASKNVLPVAFALVQTMFVKAIVLAVLVFHVPIVLNRVKKMNLNKKKLYFVYTKSSCHHQR